MAIQTIFWNHPIHGGGYYTLDTATAQDAGESAADELPGDFVEDEDDGFEEDLIRQDLTVKVWTDAHAAMPNRDPDYELV